MTAQRSRAAVNYEVRSIAQKLGGDVVNRNAISCPGPGHSKNDRSLSVTLNHHAPDGFVVHSFANEPWQECRDYVLQRLGLSRGQSNIRPVQKERSPATTSNPDRALSLWRETVDLQGTLAAQYLAARGLQAFDGMADLRFHPACPFGSERLPCMVALYRDLQTNTPKAIHRTALTPDARKIDRKVLGPKAGAAIKLTQDAEVSVCLSIAEGVETSLAGAAMFYRPVWALGDANSIAQFPVLAGLESLTVLVDNDANGVGQKAARECSQRWTAAGREVFRIIPTREGADMADIARRIA